MTKFQPSVCMKPLAPTLSRHIVSVTAPVQLVRLSIFLLQFALSLKRSLMQLMFAFCLFWLLLPTTGVNNWSSLPIQGVP